MKGDAMRGSRNQLWLVLALIATMLAVFDKPSFSATSEERETLRGVEALRVIVRVRMADADAQSLGITQEGLQADLEKTLTTAGIKVAPNVKPYLLLSVSMISISHPRIDGVLAYVYTAQLKFRQGALIDSTGTRATATTWDEVRFAASSPMKNLDSRIRKSINILVSSFVNDYLAANSETGPGKED
jgi:hypothetical protein